MNISVERGVFFLDVMNHIFASMIFIAMSHPTVWMYEDTLSALPHHTCTSNVPVIQPQKAGLAWMASTCQPSQ